LFLLESIDIEQLIIKIFQNKIQKPISIPMKKNYETLKAKIPVCKAGGGFVHNKRVRFCLFSGTENGIYLRWNRKGELKIPQCVKKEETGVNQLRVTKNYKVSHFKRNGSTSLKSPIGLKWSLVLRCAQGQLDEGIEK
jgi:hypothetical protein